MKNYVIIESPLGKLTLQSTDGKLSGLYFGELHPDGYTLDTNTLLDDTVRQLSEYFDGRRTSFDLPLLLVGTAFQRKVWDELQKIPYGETRSYGALAKAVGNAKASRAVGMANNRNPVSIIIPCHRVIGANGKLVGYGGGVSIKRYLLDLESGKAAPVIADSL